jgi:hypothetical protein
LFRVQKGYREGKEPRRNFKVMPGRKLEAKIIFKRSDHMGDGQEAIFK